MKKSSLNRVVYQIWPRSFQDSNGDGIGDLPGIIARLDYLASLNIDLIWLSPIYQSPNSDYGYDISDYYTIHEDFGTMADFDLLLAEAKKRKLNIMMDLVANHTSDQHPWFIDALRDKNSIYRYYYVFKEGKDGHEPNNWIGIFGGSAWTKVPNEENNYYLTLFTPQQPDLNWENINVRNEIYRVMKFWLDKGIAGFRMDVINLISKAAGYPDKDPQKKGYQFANELIINRDLSHEYLKEMYREVLSKYEALFLGEGMMMSRAAAALYCGGKNEELDLMFQSDLITIDCGPLGKYDFRKFYRWNVMEFKKVFFTWQVDSVKNDYYIGNYFSNHDFGRSVSRYGDVKNHRTESAKALLMLNMAARGTPFIYQGEEIGMTNLKLEQREWKDFEAINDYEMLQTMMHLPAFIAKWVVQKVTRDQARTPMQWDSSTHAGFTKGTPWLRVNPNFTKINVENDEQNPTSILNFTRRMAAVRKEHKVFTFGDFQPLLPKHPQIVAFIRSDDKDKLLVLVNLDRHAAMFKADDKWLDAPLIVSTQLHPGPLSQKMVLAPYEGRIYRLFSQID